MLRSSFAPSTDDRVIAGVCAGIAQTLAVDVTLVRLVFALLALAGGAGIVLYLALWAYSRTPRRWVAAVLTLLAGGLLLSALGLSDRSVVGIALIAAGLALAWRQGGSFHPDAPLSYGGIVLAAIGAVALLSSDGANSTLLAPGAVAGALLLIAGPWVWRLAIDRDAERTARIRSDERSDVAARVHDSVLQTLALIQRHANEPRRVASLARRQERELRGWLYGDQPIGDANASLVAALSAAAGDVEELHGVRVEIASAGDCPGRRAARRRRPRRPRGDDERGQVRGRRGDRRLRRGHRRGSRRLRPRPRRRVRPRRRAGRPARPRRVDRGQARARRRPRDDRVEPGRGHRGGATRGEECVVKRRVVLVDDHDLFLAGVRAELGDAVEVVGQAGSVAAAVPLIKELDPDVVLLDVHLPDGSGDAIINQVAPERPGVKFLALSVSDAAEDVIAVIRAGARGYVTKTISGTELAAAIEQVANGDAVFSPRLAGFVLDAFRAGDRVGGDAELDELTPREREVLQLIARGYMYKEIAARLHLSVKTVESHVSNVLRKLQLSTRHELARWATEHRLV